jgi:small-conductance mechanosensitive channel
VIGRPVVNQITNLMSHPLARSVATVVVAILFTSLLVRLVRRAVRAQIADNELRYRASKLVAAVGYIVVLIVIVAEVGGRFSGFTVALGAASAGIAFALQEVIASVAGWLAIAFGGYYKVGDRIQLGGIKGDVIDIGFVRTTIMEIGGWVNGDLYNGRIVRVANSFVFKEPVFNYSGDFPFVWDEIVVPIKYGSDYDSARGILETVAQSIVGEYAATARIRWQELVRSFRIEDARVEPAVTMIANDNWVEFTLRYVVDLRARRMTKDALFKNILRGIDATEGKVALASATVQLVGAPALRVSLDRPPTPASEAKG